MDGLSRINWLWDGLGWDGIGCGVGMGLWIRGGLDRDLSLMEFSIELETSGNERKTFAGKHFERLWVENESLLRL